MTEPTDLHDVLDLAATVAGVPGEVGPDGAITWSGPIGPFAVLAADDVTAEFRLDPELAAAARRTPDATSSERGPDWVLFRPRMVDAHAVDRASAWFAAAARRSGEPYRGIEA